MIVGFITVILGLLALVVGVGSLILAYRGQDVPPGVIATGAAAMAALVGGLRRTDKRE